MRIARGGDQQGQTPRIRKQQWLTDAETGNIVWRTVNNTTQDAES